MQKEAEKQAEEPKVQEVVEESKEEKKESLPPVAEKKSEPKSAPSTESVPVPAKTQEIRTDVSVDKTISTYNGAATSKYNWS